VSKTNDTTLWAIDAGKGGDAFKARVMANTWKVL